MSKKPLIVLAAVVALFALPELASAAKVRGTVVKVDRQSRLVAVAQAGGEVALVHARPERAVTTGLLVDIKARKLANGTFAGRRIRVLGSTSRVTVRGLVLAQRSSAFVLSARGVALTVRMRSGAQSPPIGSAVTVRASVSGGELEADDVDVVDPHATAGRVEGKLTIGAGKIMVSDEGVDVTIVVPAGFNLAHFKNGDRVVATFTRAANGTLTLTVLARDDDPAQIEDEDEDDDDVCDEHRAGAGQVGSDDDDQCEPEHEHGDDHGDHSGHGGGGGDDGDHSGHGGGGDDD